MSIQVSNLVKHFRVHQKEPGLLGSIRSFVRRRYETVHAVDGVSFSIEQGEIIGFLGPNGAGKTTTLKCLSGLLYPNGGDVRVMGFTPHQRSPAYLRQFTLVMGQRNQLMWDLPAMETFLVNQAIYDVPEHIFRQSLDELVALLNLEPLLKKQVRKLSLGERMRCELAASLLHQPRMIFLDEPTLGLDVTAQEAIRGFIHAYNERHQATVLLTSHYMADVTALAKRILVIEHGKLVYDGDLQALIEKQAPYRFLRLTLDRPVHNADLQAFGTLEAQDGLTLTLRVPRADTRDAAARALTHLPVADLSIQDPSVESIIRDLFQSGEANA